ncbi:glutamic acid-rich protein-like [Scomber japonicus]|uniref:glutamic acid-rich protein-like n=1 Tax=Scomber japonicus TaxID=13676 RepID=UPI0023068426|nr:glutamic acid-rich protein-like [Scomber japonicus]
MEKGKQVEENSKCQVACVSEPQPKRRKDSPLEDAIIKDLLKDMEAEHRVSSLRRNSPHAEGEGMMKPGHADKKESGVNSPRGSSQDVPPGTTEDMKEEEEDNEEEEDDEDDEDDEEEESDEDEGDVDSVPGSPDKPGILSQLARHMFPFSLFFRDL